MLSVSVAALVVMGFGACTAHEVNASERGDSHGALASTVDSHIKDTHCQDDTAADDAVITNGSHRDSGSQLIALIAPNTAPTTHISATVAAPPPPEITRSFTDGKTALPLRC